MKYTCFLFFFHASFLIVFFLLLLLFFKNLVLVLLYPSFSYPSSSSSSSFYFPYPHPPTATPPHQFNFLSTLLSLVSFSSVTLPGTCVPSVRPQNLTPSKTTLSCSNPKDQESLDNNPSFPLQHSTINRRISRLRGIDLPALHSSNHPSGNLRGLDWYNVTDVAGRPVTPIFKGRSVREFCLDP